MLNTTKSVLLILLLTAAFMQLSSPVQAAPIPEPAAKAGSAITVAPMDHPFLFSYGTWDKLARIEGGTAYLDAAGLTPKGGGGVNVNMDLHAHSDDSPGLRLRVGPRNTLKVLKLMLVDTAGHSGQWNFSLPVASAADVVVITPQDGAPFNQPNHIEKGAPDLGKVMQWQLMGNWGGDGPVDVRVEAILAVPANEAIRKERLTLAAAETAARMQSQKNREDLRLKYMKLSALSPIVETVYAAAPDVLAVQINTGRVIPSRLEPYTTQAGDTPKTANGSTVLVRSGGEVGWLIGPKKDGLVTYEGFEGDPPLTDEADDPTNYTVHSPDAPGFAAGIKPLDVYRKSKPTDWQQPGHAFPMQHIIYLKLPTTLIAGKTYIISLANINVQIPTVPFKFDPAAVRSESIHVSQVGFRPDDPVKRAYLSLWMGSGGEYDFGRGMEFHLVEEGTNRIAFMGIVGAGWTTDRPEKMGTTRNFNGTAVYPMDFSAFKLPGRYRLVVGGVGCSYPFEIGPKVWEKAFGVQMKGFYNQRSGIDLGPPYSTFHHPRDFYPPAGDPVFQSTYGQLDGGDQQKGLEKGNTGRVVPEAWGGYHDAGDWNPRRITHMRTTTFWQLELMELFPEFFRSLKLNVPKTHPVPDLLNECLFELDLFRRLQKPDGSVGYGIETNGDPLDGEVSWKQSMPAYIYAPDVQSTYIYAAVAARAAKVLLPYAPDEAKVYRESALKAMEWAEADRKQSMAAGTWAKLGGDVTADRTLAALSVYALAGDKRWHNVFMEDTTLKAAIQPPFYGSLQRRDAAFLYARLPEKLTDPAIRTAARNALVKDADGALVYQGNNAWGIASDDPGKPQFLGFYSNPHGGVSLLRAYWLTHDPKYLGGAVG
ncbi:MAG: glycoside hydrolase family 9 protein, partial [Armatimonadota bacterium]|nr:glycoside hydrolase family 9 protein [Armatimonadota bacterium]